MNCWAVIIWDIISEIDERLSIILIGRFSELRIKNHRLSRRIQSQRVKTKGDKTDIKDNTLFDFLTCDQHRRFERFQEIS